MITTISNYRMSINSQDYHGLWRASANEGVPYAEDFPEPFLVLPELIDGALGDGEADKIWIKFDITNPKKCSLQIRDNGKGIVNQKRMQDWTSKKQGTHGKEHEYGHGSKKMLTKWMPDYTSAVWNLCWRKQDKRGLSGSLNKLCSPFKGLETLHEQDDDNEDICPQHGTEWNIEFNLDILGSKFNTSNAIMSNLKELLCIRYEPSHYKKPYIFDITIINGPKNILNDNSKNWKSLKESLDDKVKLNNRSVSRFHESTFRINSTDVKCDFYRIETDGRGFSLDGFPKFGKKNMNAARLHMGRCGRYIEAKKLSKFLNKESHNSLNGIIGFVMFSGDELPTPCTTKVKFQEECSIYKKCRERIIELIDFTQEMPKPLASAPAPKPVEPKPLASAPAPKPVEPKPLASAPAPAPKPVEPKPLASAPAPAPAPKPSEQNQLDINSYNVLENLYSKYGEKWIIDNLNKIKHNYNNQ